MEEPSITDWISSIGTLLGIPAAVWGIIELFRRNKEQDRKIDSLESLATAQNIVVIKMSEQIIELSRHTSEFQYQSELMKEANEIMRIRIDLQNQNFIQNKESESKKLELQKLERLSNIKPHFVYIGGFSDPNKFSINLLNKGHTAKIIEFKQIDNWLATIIRKEKPLEYQQNENLTIEGYANPSKTYYNSNQVPFDLEITYTDIDNNTYRQILSRKSETIRLTNPELVNTPPSECSLRLA